MEDKIITTITTENDVTIKVTVIIIVETTTIAFVVIKAMEKAVAITIIKIMAKIFKIITVITVIKVMYGMLKMHNHNKCRWGFNSLKLANNTINK